MKRVFMLGLAVVLCLALAGCGETFSGVGKDTNRMGKGLNTFFFRQGN